METKFKESGIPWIGQIPQHWEILKISYIFSKIGSGTTPTSSNPFYYSDKGINWLQTGDLNDGIITDTSKKITPLALKDFSSLKLYPKNSIVIAMYGATIGKLGRLAIETTTNQACCVLSSEKEASNIYVFYVLAAGKQALIDLANGAGQPNISQDTIKSLRIPFPPLAEQKQIASYLDSCCGDIDELIDVEQQMIADLNAYRLSLITETVTRGLNPDVPTIPSNIPWLGNTPKHWKSCRFKDFLFLQSASSDSNYKIGLENIESNTGKFITTESIFDGIGTHFSPKDIIYGKLRPYLRKVWVADTEGSAVGDFFVFRCKAISDPIYVKYLMLSEGFTQAVMGSVYGTKMPRVSSEFILTLPYYLPPLAEQQEIAEYLDGKCREIDELILLKREKISTLKQYRASLIFETVTGKHQPDGKAAVSPPAK